MANKVIENFDVVGIFSQQKHEKRHPAKRAEILDEPGVDQIREYVQEFEIKEKKYLLPYADEFKIGDGCKLVSVGPTEMSSPRICAEVDRMKADCFAVFGTSLIKEELLRISPNFINIHLGLSPYYKGTGGSFWPFFNNEPEYVGVTVFLLDPGIDSGPILHQSLVTLEKGGDIHDASMKAILAGVNLQIQSLKELEDGKLTSYPQPSDTGKTYFAKDFQVEHLMAFRKNWTSDRYYEYIENQEMLKSKITFIP